jgi:hypothetical protein
MAFYLHISDSDPIFQDQIKWQVRWVPVVGTCLYRCATQICKKLRSVGHLTHGFPMDKPTGTCGWRGLVLTLISNLLNMWVEGSVGHASFTCRRTDAWDEKQGKTCLEKSFIITQSSLPWSLLHQPPPSHLAWPSLKIHYLREGFGPETAPGGLKYTILEKEMAIFEP